MEDFESKLYPAKQNDWKILVKHIEFEKNHQIKGRSSGRFEENLNRSQKGKHCYGWKVAFCLCWCEEEKVSKSYTQLS